MCGHRFCSTFETPERTTALKISYYGPPYCTVVLRVLLAGNVSIQIPALDLFTKKEVLVMEMLRKILGSDSVK